MPKVQDALKAYVGVELGKNINTDEAAALGAVYKAADLATGFRVSKFIVKEAVLFPIQVTFEREGNSGSTKIVKRNLFTAFGSYPQKKVITFNKNTEDFAFDVIYGDLEHLSAEEIKSIGSLQMMKIKLSEVANIISANTAENIEAKGIKAHFILDDSGLFTMPSVEFVADKNVTEQDEESSFAKLGSTITKLFSSGGDGEEKKKEPEQETPEADESSANKTADGDATANQTASNDTQSANATEKKPTSKIVNIKEPIPFNVEILYAVDLKGDKYEESRKKVDDLNELELQTVRRESALNALESFVIEANQRLDEEEYASCATSDESEGVRKACAEVQDWIYEDGANADADTYEKKLSELQAKANPIYARHWEHRERPETLETFTKMIGSAKTFLANAKNMTKETNTDKDIFTQVEIDTLQKAINEGEQWIETEQAEQNKLQRYEPIRMTVKSITDRMMMLDREVKYLINKIKIWKPKVKETPKKAKKSTNETTESETTEEKPVEEKPVEEKVEETIEEPTATNDESEHETTTTAPESSDGQDEHNEL